jgi:hypothetical protein
MVKVGEKVNILKDGEHVAVAKVAGINPTSNLAMIMMFQPDTQCGEEKDKGKVGRMLHFTASLNSLVLVDGVWQVEFTTCTAVA